MSTKLKAGTSTSGAVLDADTTGILQLQTGSTPTTAVTIDASQNVGIGTATPATICHISGAASTNNTSRFVTKFTDTSAVATNNGGGIMFQGIYTGSTAIDCAGIQAAKENATDGNYSYAMTFANRSNGNNLTEKMRIDSSGNLLVGTTSTISPFALIHVRADNKGIAIQDSSDNSYRAIYNQSGTLYFYNGTNEGYLNSAGAWVNASDAGLKNNITEIKYGLDTVMQTQPRSYKMNDLEGDYIGFVAQELQTVIPEVVSGNPKKQLGVDYGSLVAVAFKAIQELNAKVDAQATTIAELQARTA
jgi:hypothetical protein